MSSSARACSGPHAPHAVPHCAARARGCRRSVTLAGGVSPPPTVDFNYTAGVVQLCSGCRFVLADLVLANERRGSGPEIDAFAGEPSSVVETRNVLRLRQACTPSALAARAAAGMSRSGDGYGQAQQLRLANVTYAVRPRGGSRATQRARLLLCGLSHMRVVYSWRACLCVCLSVCLAARRACTTPTHSCTLTCRWWHQRRARTATASLAATRW